MAGAVQRGGEVRIQTTPEARSRPGAVNGNRPARSRDGSVLTGPQSIRNRAASVIAAGVRHPSSAPRNQGGEVCRYDCGRPAMGGEVSEMAEQSGSGGKASTDTPQ